MFSTEECIILLDNDILRIDDALILHCSINTLEIPARNLSITLNESQKRLLSCLLKKINCKRDIINVVWYENHQRISDNNYHQLTFQMRSLFNKNGLPENLLVTVPYYGLKLNESAWRSLKSDDNTKEVQPVKTKKEASKKGSLINKKNISLLLLFIFIILILCWFR